MTLRFPDDLDAWSNWYQRRNRVRSLRNWAFPRPEQVLELSSYGKDPDILIAIESLSKSNVVSLIAPIHHLERERIAILAPSGLSDMLHIGDVTPERVTTSGNLHQHAPSIRVVLSAGNYLHAGRVASELAVRYGLPDVVIQHGLLTQLAPPLPRGAHLLAWSVQDGDFWGLGRNDVRVKSVGSQLLWSAARDQRSNIEKTRAPTFLGQLHGAELPRMQMARLAGAFCREYQAGYRPHPLEQDRLSRLQHKRWERQGIIIDRTSREIRDLGTPVVGVFSTGILEAAASGIPSWVTHPAPPAWIRDLWDRYSLGIWGHDATPPPFQPTLEPAAKVADILDEFTKGT